jgi:Tol biopolymer transport system component
MIHNLKTIVLTLFIVLAISACNKSVTIKQEPIDFEPYKTQKVFVIKQADKYRVYVWVPNKPEPGNILRSPRPILFPRLSNNEMHIIYASEESGKTFIYAQKLSTGRRQNIARSNKKIIDLDFGDNDFEIVYKDENGEGYLVNIDSSF